MHAPEPQSHTSSNYLNPVTSLNTLRYNRSCSNLSIQHCPQVINRGPVRLNSATSVSKWRRFVHPEGQPYFVLNSEFDFAIVTEANVEDTQIGKRLSEYMKLAYEELKRHSIEVPSRCELFLELGEDDTSCNYYFVDHIGKGLFWLNDLSTESLDIPAATSASHLAMAMERLYWVHVEFFPMHHESHQGEFSDVLDDLCNVISHGQADRLTSRTSTFPYTVDTCRQFLELLSRKKGQRVDGYTLCYAARLAGAIMNQRFITFYGQESAQLDRLQQMYPVDAVEHEWLSTVANVSMWGVPRYYKGLLEDLYLNEQVYADQWTKFMLICLADWTNCLSWTFPVLIANVLLANVRGGSVKTTIPSVLSCVVSIASASCLHLRYHSLTDMCATVSARYLRHAKSKTLGFLPLSVVYSLPKAFFLWALGFLFAHILFIASHGVGKLAALVAASTIATIFILILRVIYPEGDFATLLTFRNFTGLHLGDGAESEV